MKLSDIYAILLSLIYFIVPLISADNISSNVQKNETLICITQIVEHPSLDKIRLGIEKKLKRLNRGKKINIVYENAQGNIAIASQIARNFFSLSPDIVVAISTPSAQTVLAAARDCSNVPIVFTGITDPLSAKLVYNLEEPGGFVTGVIDLPPIDLQIDLMLKILPNLKKLGVIYNSSEVNSQKQLKLLQEYALKKNIKIVTSSISKSSEVSTAAAFLVNKIDAIFIPNDNTVISALEGIIDVSKKFKIPVFTSDVESVKRGAIAALANDQFKMGEETADIILQILDGKFPGKIDVQNSKNTVLFINNTFAGQIELNIPLEIIKKADKLF